MSIDPPSVHKRYEKNHRILFIWEELRKKQTISKQELAQKFQVSPKTIQRDLESLRNYLAEQNVDRPGSTNIILIYSPAQKTYLFQQEEH